MLPTISHEQSAVVDAVRDGFNVAVESVAGSGKTTCSLYIAKTFSDKNVLLLTYNAKLKTETRERVRAQDIGNMAVHSYHSFCVHTYDNECFTDSEIRSAVRRDAPNIAQVAYDIIILDETQDMSFLYYDLFCKICRDNACDAQLVVVGDRMQSIFAFNGADERFMVHAARIFGGGGQREWVARKLSTSFRITRQMAAFVNECMLHDDRMHAIKDGPLPRYIVCELQFQQVSNMRNGVFAELMYYIDDCGYAPHDIFLLVPSVKNSQKHIVELENKLKRERPEIRLYVPSSDGEKPNDAVMVGKLVFSTFHQSKGLERKVVVVLSFDDSYYMYYNKGGDRTKCCNELYVAATRASERLSVVHHWKNPMFSFMNLATVKKTCEYNCPPWCRTKVCEYTIPHPPKPPDVTNPSDLLQYQKQHVVDACFAMLEREMLRPPADMLDNDNVAMYIDGPGCESVSDITGTAIPEYLQLMTQNHMSMYSTMISDHTFQKRLSTTGNLRADLAALDCRETYDLFAIDVAIDKLRVDELMYITTCWMACKSKFLFKLYQIQNYNWLTAATLLKGAERTRAALNLSPTTNFEAEIYVTSHGTPRPELAGIKKFTGYVDCIDKGRVFELKCTQTLSKEHYLQLALYMYMNETGGTITHCAVTRRARKTTGEYFLYNIFTDELVQVRCSVDDLRTIVQSLVIAKYGGTETVTDAEFLYTAAEFRKQWAATLPPDDPPEE